MKRTQPFQHQRESSSSICFVDRYFVLLCSTVGTLQKVPDLARTERRGGRTLLAFSSAVPFMAPESRSPKQVHRSRAPVAEPRWSLVDKSEKHTAPENVYDSGSDKLVPRRKQEGAAAGQILGVSNGRQDHFLLSDKRTGITGSKLVSIYDDGCPKPCK